MKRANRGWSPSVCRCSGDPVRWSAAITNTYVAARATYFLFVEPKAGLRYVRVTRHRKRPDFAQCIQWLVDELYPEIPWIRHFKDQVRQRTRRRVPLATEELVKELNPILRGWGNYYKRAHVRDLFNQLDRWIVQRLWSHQHKHWRCCGWKTLPRSKLYGEYGLVNLIALIPSMASQKKESS